MIKTNIKLFLFTASLISIDLISKNQAIKYLENGNVDLLFGAKLILAFNEGIAFSIPIKGILQIVLSFVFLAIFILYAYKYWNLKNTMTTISISLIFGGALGNLYERIMFGRVTDFISLFSWYPTFNLADSFIFIGVIMILFFEKGFKKSLN